MVDGAKAEAVKARNPIVPLVNTTAQALSSQGDSTAATISCARRKRFDGVTRKAAPPLASRSSIKDDAMV
jgi:hypothetical protein